MSWMQKKDPRGDLWKCLRRKRGCNGGAPKENLAQKKRLLLWKRQHFLNTLLQTVECIISCPYISPLWEPKISADKLLITPTGKKKITSQFFLMLENRRARLIIFLRRACETKQRCSAPLHRSICHSAHRLACQKAGWKKPAISLSQDSLPMLWPSKWTDRKSETHTHTRADTTSETTTVKDDTAVGFSICSYKQTQTGHVVFWPSSFSVSQSP